MSTYQSILTDAGLAAEAASHASGTPIKITHFAVGDGNGTAYTVSSSQTGLKRETYRAPVNAIRVDTNNTNYLIVECVVPASVGGWYVREAAVILDTGTVWGVANYPDTYKPALSDGAGKDLYLRLIFEVSNAADVSLKIDPSVVLASRQYVDDAARAAITQHEASGTHADASETSKGFVRLATNTETLAGNSKALAVHPAGLKATVDALVGGAPGALDTLKELATALGNDANFATSVANALALKAPLASPALTGTPTVPTAAAGTATTQAASTAFVAAAIGTAAAGYAKTTTSARIEAPQDSFSGDLNKIEVGGLYTAGISGASNTPPGWTLGMLSQFAEVPGWDVAKQFLSSTDGKKLMFRTKWGGGSGANWSTWNTIWSAENDGAGSGLDADLLDGLHAGEITGTTRKYLVLDQYNGNVIRNSLGVSSITDHAVGQYTVSFTTPWPYTYYVPATCNVGNTGPADAPECVVIEDRADYMVWTTGQIRMAHRPSGEDYYVDGRPDTIIFAGM